MARPVQRAQRRAAAALTAEQRDERLAPAAQRRPVVAVSSATGDVIMLRGPRVERAGYGFVTSSPMRNLWSRGRRRDTAATVAVPRVTDQHLACAERLLRSWNLTAEGVSVPGGFTFDRIGGAPSTGYISPAVLHAVNEQLQHFREWRAARAFLGPPLWDAILNVALLGRDVKSWANSKHWHEVAATGYLIAALDRLVEFYVAITPKNRPRSKAAIVVTSQQDG